jgi:quinol monooxygenase YgiN
MPQTPVTVIAEGIAKAGNEDEVRGLFLGLLEPTRKEEGCIQYDLHEEADKPGHFMFSESWSSKAALDAHLTTPHVTSTFARLPELLEGMPRIWVGQRIG